MIATTLNFTDAAAKKAKDLILEEGNQKLNLRVYITGGGCSGFQYGFVFDQVKDDDITVTKIIAEKGQDVQTKDHQKVTLLIDPLSFHYLKGAEIDYQEGIEGSQFVIRNPNAKTTCGCGSSFSI